MVSPAAAFSPLFSSLRLFSSSSFASFHLHSLSFCLSPLAAAVFSAALNSGVRKCCPWRWWEVKPQLVRHSQVFTPTTLYCRSLTSLCEVASIYLSRTCLVCNLLCFICTMFIRWCNIGSVQGFAYSMFYIFTICICRSVKHWSSLAKSPPHCFSLFHWPFPSAFRKSVPKNKTSVCRTHPQVAHSVCAFVFVCHLEGLTVCLPKRREELTNREIPLQ